MATRSAYSTGLVNALLPGCDSPEESLEESRTRACLVDTTTIAAEAISKKAGGACRPADDVRRLISRETSASGAGAPAFPRAEADVLGGIALGGRTPSLGRQAHG